MDDTHGYPVVTAEGKKIGRVAGQSEAALVVERGTWPRKTWQALPKRFASIDQKKRRVVMQVSKGMLAMSPKLQKDVPLDDEDMASWWGIG